jgi:hypothetical protein
MMVRPASHATAFINLLTLWLSNVNRGPGADDSGLCDKRHWDQRLVFLCASEDDLL